jgi:nucleotide-binding universal stress UspA family protein
MSKQNGKGMIVFKNIMVPYDGSDLSKRGLEKAIALAKLLGAQITGFHVAPDLDSSMRAYLPEAAYIPEEYNERAGDAAKEQLREIEHQCAAAGVPYSVHYVVSEFVADSIVEAAEKYKCDLIAIASHGRTGLARVMLGSQTQKVLGHSSIPVLVFK